MPPKKKTVPAEDVGLREMLAGWICYVAIFSVNITIAFVLDWWGLLSLLLLAFCIPPLLFMLYWAGK